jgi:2-phospho-L-lactate transferase/gluconeogenesis factor (CofD/UPF0052 family)/8-oxo-dGTP pyrophosphatase MutT (NUDIX family)/methylmalonyl-CoA mutase cobalamin-binding subunit
MPKETGSEELVSALDPEGRPLKAGVTRAEAHRRGIWHQTVSVFVLNDHGEVLIERRSDFKDLFPGYYDIVGGHLGPGQKPVEGARQEIKEELSLDVPPERLEVLSGENEVIERVVLPDRGIINLERKTVYLLTLDRAEETMVFKLAARLLRLTPEELEDLGTTGEVSRIEFWNCERLLATANSTGKQALASGALSALHNANVQRAIADRCRSLCAARRQEFVARYGFLHKRLVNDYAYDRWLFDCFVEQPGLAASVEEAKAVFEKGPEQLGGAYEMGPFRQAVAGDDHWEPKLRDPEMRYVSNIVGAVAYGQKATTQRKLEKRIPDIQCFVRDLLNFPLSDGTRFRDKLSNLADIAVARKAVLFWLKNAVRDLLPAKILSVPTGAITQECLQAGRELCEKSFASLPNAGLARLRELLLVGLGASSADFNNPAFRRHLKLRSRNDHAILRFLEQRISRNLSQELGGDRFLQEFYEEYVKSGKSVTIAYLAGNTAQAHTSLTIAQEILRMNTRARIYFITKSGSPGNDLTLKGARNILCARGDCGFADLIRFKRRGRFALILDGPRGHGLDPNRLPRAVGRALAGASVILAEGQAYAEIRGWRKPTYIAFRVNGRVAEAVHGLSRHLGRNGFVRLTPGIDHFQGFESVIRRILNDAQDDTHIHVAAQTTAEYVKVIQSENFDFLVRYLYQGNHVEACRQIQTEANRLGKTFAQVVIGAASKRPSSLEVARHFRRMRFPVFACGGGGGFSCVTLRALRALGLPTVAGVPSTDDGGSTGELQRWLRRDRGFVFGVGDMAAILEGALSNRGKQALLAYRFDCEPKSLTNAVMERIAAESADPTYSDSPLRMADDFLSFVCGQLELARVIERVFREKDSPDKLPIKGASIRNLNVIAAYELCGMLGDKTEISDESRLASTYLLQKALGLPADLLVAPVTYSESVIYLDYEKPIPTDLAEKFNVPHEAIANDRRRLYGQQFIDKLPHSGARVSVGVARTPKDPTKPIANPEYLRRIREADLFVMGAGSLIGSQLSQLVVPGVVDVLVERQDMRRILVLNHVNQDETLGMSLSDQVRLIETAATQSASPGTLSAIDRKRLRISNVFTDIVVPRTIARELDIEMARIGDDTSSDDCPPRFVNLPRSRSKQTIRIFCNRYVNFLLKNPEVVERYGITTREIEVLSYLDQPAALYQHRSEAGRYRGALFATQQDIDYLVGQGIQRRSIHEVDSIGENWKFVKSEGAPRLEFFPGLVPEALVGIFRIAMERTSSTLEPRGAQRFIRPPE